MRSNETIDALRDILGTALNVNQALVTLSQGEVVKRLAGCAAVLAVPTLVASWYSMNFENMPELDGRSVRKSTRLNSIPSCATRMPSSALNNNKQYKYIPTV